MTAIAAGGQFTVALKIDTTVVEWGRNLEGQRNIPAGLTGVTAIAAGGWHTVALVAAPCDADLAAANATIATLTSQVSALVTQNEECQSQLTFLTTLNGLLQNQLAAANATIASLNSQNASFQTQLNAISQQYLNLAQNFQAIFNYPQFQISGSTPAQQTDSVVAAIGNLNRGQKKALYKNLGGKK